MAMLTVLAGAVGCGAATESSPDPTVTSSATFSASSASPSGLPTAQTAGSDGLTVRYRDDAGAIKTVRVEDFPH